MNKSAKQRILILGGGFGGVYAAFHLQKLLAARLARAAPTSPAKWPAALMNTTAVLEFVDANLKK